MRCESLAVLRIRTMVLSFACSIAGPVVVRAAPTDLAAGLEAYERGAYDRAIELWATMLAGHAESHKDRELRSYLATLIATAALDGYREHGNEALLQRADELLRAYVAEFRRTHALDPASQPDPELLDLADQISNRLATLEQEAARVAAIDTAWTTGLAARRQGQLREAAELWIAACEGLTLSDEQRWSFVTATFDALLEAHERDGGRAHLQRARELIARARERFGARPGAWTAGLDQMSARLTAREGQPTAQSAPAGFTKIDEVQPTAGEPAAVGIGLRQPVRSPSLHRQPRIGLTAAKILTGAGAGLAGLAATGGVILAASYRWHAHAEVRDDCPNARERLDRCDSSVRQYVEREYAKSNWTFAASGVLFAGGLTLNIIGAIALHRHRSRARLGAHSLRAQPMWSPGGFGIALRLGP